MERTCWEDEVLSAPDEPDVSALFSDIDSDDERQQYEAVAGLYWLADLRPNRLWDRREDVIDLLGALPDFRLGDSGSSGTRRWVTQAVGKFVRAHPELLPDVFARAARTTNRCEKTRSARSHTP